MRKFLKRALPTGFVKKYRSFERNLRRKRSARKTTEEVFDEIYAVNLWGGEPGDYFSGDGTADDSIAKGYLEAMIALAERLNFSELSAVEIGCGDMRIGSKIAPLFKDYLGVDIVKGLVERNTEKFGSKTLSFVQRNVVTEEIPAGDVCMVRQVLQHLSNDQICAILPKLKNFRYVIVTEHLPSPAFLKVKNLDKPHGADIRIYQRSGVYLEAAPYNIPKTSLEKIYEIPGNAFEDLDDPGVIVTQLYYPARV